MMCVYESSFLEREISPVNSLTLTPKKVSFYVNFLTISVARAFKGEI